MHDVHMDVKIGTEVGEDEFQVLAHDWNPIDELFAQINDLHLFVVVINYYNSTSEDQVQAGFKTLVCSRLPRLYASQRLDVVVNVILSIEGLSPGDIVGEGIELYGEPVRRVTTAGHAPERDHEPSRSFEVVRRLATGDFRSVYLVRELRCHDTGSKDNDINDTFVRGEDLREYGNKYVLKVLDTEDLDEDARAGYESKVCSIRGLVL